ncbi:MAG: cation:H+ antiporter [Motiliproteus sp.]|jgi:cation:H+ antiporter
MELYNAVWPFALILLACYLLKYSCDTFEQSASYLGRNMPAGVKGATVNAIGSSMPEMAVVVSCLFFFNDPGMVMVGLGVTAGSAVFNGCVIPALSILLAKDEHGNKVNSISLNKNALLRDLFWVLTAEISLIYFLGFDAFTITMAVVLNVIYIGYGVHLYIDSRGHEADDDYEYEEINDYGIIGNILSFNFNSLFFSNKTFNLTRALVVIASATAIITGASHILVEGVVGAAEIMGVPAFFSGLILGSAASSIPDLLLSVKDARNGNYEDAVANPLASNTFDTTVAFALPLMVWFMIYGVDSLVIEQSDGLTFLRWSIVAVTAAVGASLLFKYTNVTKNVAFGLLAMFAIWLVTAVSVIS